MYDRQVAMDWFSWLSRTGLDRVLIYNYGLIFTRNELEEEDLKSFDHEFLQSMGISVAKHRLEILKLTKEEIGERPSRVSTLILAINKAKKRFAKSIGKWAFPRESTHTTGHGLTPFQAHWSGALRKQYSSNEFSRETVMATSRRPMRMKSGPLERRVQDRFMVMNRSPTVSGPLDGKLQEKLVAINRSPTISDVLDGRVQESFLFSNKSPDISGPFDAMDSSPKVKSHCGKEKMAGGNGVGPQWSIMFQDMKPT
ncbi:uncharacterized protein LOC130790759 [Actinidia eriantha]|uniref:uncharacterized protein LOC130790759 n=1 Tax=Actinidia eriantha TaxID=165200 RepID=UPI00258D1D9A|nr:uncharacterized protein LOC130790759 [Actinidia eriantha]